MPKCDRGAFTLQLQLSHCRPDDTAFLPLPRVARACNLIVNVHFLGIEMDDVCAVRKLHLDVRGSENSVYTRLHPPPSPFFCSSVFFLGGGGTR